MSLIPNSPEILLPSSCLTWNLERLETRSKQASFDVSAGRFHNSLVFLYKQPDDVGYISDGHAGDEGCQRACNSGVAFKRKQKKDDISRRYREHRRHGIVE